MQVVAFLAGGAPAECALATLLHQPRSFESPLAGTTHACPTATLISCAIRCNTCYRMMDSYSADFIAALHQASVELGLADYYQPCVRPLFHMPVQQWPMCCGGHCEPCSQILIAVANRTAELLQIDVSELR